MRPYPEIVASLAGKAEEMLPLSKQADSEHLAVLSAKRRVFKVFLDVEGLAQGPIPAELIQAAADAGAHPLHQYLQSIARIRQYAGSPERLRWNPGAAGQEPPVSFDWFVNSDFPQDWDALDFLSRCERIYSDQAFTAEGFLFTRIFNHRVKLHAGYEDGLRLVLTRTEVGEYVAPPQYSTPTPEPAPEPVAAARVEPIDLVRRLSAFDGQEPRDYDAACDVPMGKPYMRFKFTEVEGNRFASLEQKLGPAAFGQIVAKMGYRIPEGPFQTWRGSHDLPLYYYVRPGDKPGSQELILVTWGEYQPGRYIADIEGFWRVFDAKL